jgi:tetratricopeptide (TPR) repeat protein
MFARSVFLAAVLLAVTSPVHAGLYYSGEQIADLPAQWRGFLLDLRLLRSIAFKPTGAAPASPIRKRYQEVCEKLEKAARERKLTADESADLGALYIRLGEPGKAVEVLRSAQRQYPGHFAITANLGTAWLLQGDYDQAIAALEEGARLAPEKRKRAEEYQLKLVRLRREQGANGPRSPRDALDNQFGVRYGGAGDYQLGKLTADDRKKLPADAVALVQQLSLWLPADGPLLWQLAELAGVYGDVRMAAAIMDGCVSEFGLQSPELRRRRQLARAAADQLGKGDVLADAKANHEGHPGGLKFRSKRPLESGFNQALLPPVDPKGVNPVPWSVFTETTLDKQFHPTFAKHLNDLNGKQIELSGYMQPLSEELDVGAFMLIEYPVGCWYCEMPELAGIVLVEQPAGKTTPFTRERVRIVGTLSLNATDPENFLYTISKAKVVQE